MPASHFLLNAFTIVLIDLLLAGDNALVIALAVRGLPVRERRLGIICGAVLAVILRVALTAIASRLLTLPYLALAGGLFVLWVAFQVLADADEPSDAVTPPRRLLDAIWVIVLADLTMSVDNILAIAGASGGHIGLIVFGLCLSIPFVVFASNLLSRLMDRYPWLILAGAAILGKVAGDMIVEDPFVRKMLNPPVYWHYGFDAVLVGIILVVGWGGMMRARSRAKVETSETSAA